MGSVGLGSLRVCCLAPPCAHRWVGGRGVAHLALGFLMGVDVADLPPCFDLDASRWPISVYFGSGCMTV